MRRAIEDLVDIVGSEPQLMQLLREDERVLRLIADLAAAAESADSEAKLVALSRVAQSGVRDDAAIDEARFMIGILDQLCVIHVRALLAYEQGECQTDRELAAALVTSKAVASALRSHLQRLGLLVQYVPPSHLLDLAKKSVSELGLEVLRLLREPADEPLDASPTE